MKAKKIPSEVPGEAPNTTRTDPVTICPVCRVPCSTSQEPMSEGEGFFTRWTCGQHGVMRDANVYSHAYMTVAFPELELVDGAYVPRERAMTRPNLPAAAYVYKFCQERCICKCHGPVTKPEIPVIVPPFPEDP